MASEKAASASPPISPHEAPEEQRQFCSLVTQFQKEQMVYPQETNPIRKAGMLPPDPYRYEPQVRALFGPQPQFVKWTGRLRFATSGRSVGIVFTPTCDPPQMIQFANFVEQPGFPGQDRATVIHTDSPLARTLAHAQASDQPALVSGSLVPISGLTRLNQALGGMPKSGQGRALFRSSFSSVGASLAQPNYLVQFTFILLPDEKKAVEER